MLAAEVSQLGLPAAKVAGIFVDENDRAARTGFLNMQSDTVARPNFLH
jgi:hypothetical protein